MVPYPQLARGRSWVAGAGENEPSRLVGFVGLGHMGSPMARKLIEGGVGLVVYDAAPGRAEAFAHETGGRAAPDLPELARKCGVVITMLPTGDVVREVVLGGSDRPGLTDGLAPGALVVDMGSSDPRIYRELEPTLAARGARLIDAPVSGGVKGAQAAALTIMAGGDAAAIGRVAPLFALMGRRIFRTGGLGTAQAMKALNNLTSAGALILTLEVLLIGQRFGLDPELMTEILNTSTGRNNSTERKIIPHVLSRTFDSGFALALMTKDLVTALGIAETTGTAARLGAQTLEIARRALETLGTEADHTAIARLLEMETGEELRSTRASERPV